jgi:hypothetical protein
MPFPDGGWMKLEVEWRFFTPAARKSLEQLKSEFEAKSAVYPSLEHVLIESDDRARAFDTDNYDAAHHFNPVEVRRIPSVLPDARPDGDAQSEEFYSDPIFGSAHYFIDAKSHRGHDAFKEFSPLARTVVDVLTDVHLLARLRNEEVYPRDLIVAENLACRKWMTLVHTIARVPKAGGLLRRVDSTLYSNPLRPGVSAWALSVGVFHASALALDRLLLELTEQASAARALGALAVGSRPVTSFGLLARCIAELERVRKQYNAPEGQWGDFPETVNHALAELFANIGTAPGQLELVHYLNTELGTNLTTEAHNEIRRRVAKRHKLSFEKIDRLAIAEVVKFLNDPEAPTPAPPAGKGDPSRESLSIDYERLAISLSEQSKPIQAAPVRFMQNQDAAPAQDIAVHVHGASKTTDQAMRKNARETSMSLAAMGSTLYFRLKGGMMHKKISPE